MRLNLNSEIGLARFGVETKHETKPNLPNLADNIRLLGICYERYGIALCLFRPGLSHEDRQVRFLQAQMGRKGYGRSHTCRRAVDETKSRDMMLKKSRRHAAETTKFISRLVGRFPVGKERFFAVGLVAIELDTTLT